MKHLKAFEKWENPIAQTKVLRDINNLFGALDDETYEMPTESQLQSEASTLEELLKIKDILKASGIDSEIEVLYEQAKDQVGQYQILVFDYEGDKLYATGFAGPRTISIYHYGHNTLCTYRIPMTENYRNEVEELEDPHEKFNDLLINGWPEDGPGVDSSPPTQEQIRQQKRLEFKAKIIKQLEEERKKKSNKK